MTYPEIRIRYGWLLSDNTSKHLNELWGDGTPLMKTEEYEMIAKNYQRAWKPYEKKVLHGMYEKLGLSFRQDIIDVYIAPWMTAFSDPMVIGVVYEPDRFVDVLTHELLHRLLTDNNESAYDTQYRTRWEKLFGNQHEFNTIVHIPVHATMQALFNDVLKEPQRTTRDKKECKQWPDYYMAWQYIDKNGYKKIITKLKEDYELLAKR